MGPIVYAYSWMDNCEQRLLCPGHRWGGQLKAPVITGSVAHGGGDLSAGAQILISVAGFADLKFKDSVDWGVSGNPGNVTVTSFVSSPTTLALVVSNQSASSITLPALTWYAHVTKRA